MKITILAVGKKHNSLFLEGIQDYCKRLSHSTSVNWRLLSPANSSLEPSKAKQQESSALDQAIQKDDFIILLDERGQLINSPELAAIIKQQSFNNKNIVFIIGGAFGVDDNLRQRADLIWSLSPLVFPHQMVRLILSEQLYRASTINNGQKYHHL